LGDAGKCRQWITFHFTLSTYATVHISPVIVNVTSDLTDAAMTLKFLSCLYSTHSIFYGGALHGLLFCPFEMAIEINLTET
jgi:hypothetical protein